MAKCDICDHWARQLSAGLCPECKTEYDPDPTTVIGIAGPARCGKDTAADYLVGECNGEIPMGETPDGAIVSCKLGDALREALAKPGVTQVKRCIGYGGLWYVYV